ncbi:hypothetical protein COU60_02715 [Candidatus Pacearchaeota archaeon CG10_big_fil_rev_8_21_14_0_10_34_76]|nr:MAG: hypothetical protein COU60_02715 [Candidatus Pacearchaeota archaeon CG10_big_fil_rev_8_21_14_0_10_34_76]
MILTLDIGGTHIRIAIISNGKIKDKRQIPTPKKKSEIISSIENLISSYDLSKIENISLGVPGTIKNNKIIGANNTDINGLDFKKILQKKFGLPIFIDNDANCAALGEIHYGHGKKYRNFIMLTLGTGIGGAIIISRKIFRGNSSAGEFCNMLIDKKRFEESVSASTLRKIAKNSGMKNAYTKIGEKLGIGILNLTYVLDPEIVILGGGISNAKDIYPPIQKIMKEKDILKRNIHVIKAKLGNNAGLIGASLLKNEEHNKRKR